MENQIDFIFEQKKIDSEYLSMRKELLIFANQEIAKENISPAKKFRLLTAFVGDFASQHTNNNGDCPATMALSDNLWVLKQEIEKEFDFEGKLAKIRITQERLDEEVRAWQYAKLSDCVLLPDNNQ